MDTPFDKWKPLRDRLVADVADLDSLMAELAPPPPPPTIDPIPDFTAQVGQAVYFSASISDGYLPVTYRWDFGDGTVADVSVPSHTYTATGNYTVRLSVIDSLGRVAVQACNGAIVPVPTTPPPTTAPPTTAPPVVKPPTPTAPISWQYNKTSNVLTLTIAAPTPTATTYLVKIQRPDNVADYVMVGPSLVGTYTPPIIEPLPNKSETYRWWYNAANTAGTSNWSAQAGGCTITQMMGGGQPTTTAAPFPPTTTTLAPQPPLPIPPPATADYLLLPKELLTAIRQKVNTPQWNTFRSHLDAELGTPWRGGYQASNSPKLSSYALAYLILKDSSPELAADYADKAIAIVWSLCHDYQKGGWNALEYLARGDGVTKTFQLAPGRTMVPGSLSVYIGKVTTLNIVRGSTDSDFLGPGQKVLEIWNSFNVVYSEGIDFVIDYDTFVSQKGPVVIKWIGARKPDAGTSYQVTVAGYYGATPAVFSPNRWSLRRSSLEEIDSYQRACAKLYGQPMQRPLDDSRLLIEDSRADFSFWPSPHARTTPVRANLSGNTITLPNAPTVDQAVLVEYVYHEDNGLRWQQTGTGDGGFNSIYIDTGYTSRFLGKHVAMCYDWLYDYLSQPGIVVPNNSSLLIRWSDYLRDYGYHYGIKQGGPHFASNYCTGTYCSQVLTAVALNRRGHPEGARLMSEVLAVRPKLVELIGAPAVGKGSLQGGFWPEGWNYGALAVQNINLATLALEQAGVI